MRKMLIPTHINKIIVSRKEFFWNVWGMYALGMTVGYLIGKFAS
jgi:hypothetical protein